MRVDFSPPDIGEREIAAVAEVLRSGWITTGPRTKSLEHEIESYTGCERAICLNSATAALEASLILLGIGEGDEVLVPAYTYTASASVILHVGAKPVMVDTLPDSVFMDLAQLADKVTEKTKAIIPVDIAGVPVDYDELYRIIESKRALFRPVGELQTGLGRIAVVADCAHSFGARYRGKDVACRPDFACFSFHAVKNLTTAEGGVLCFRAIGNIGVEELYRRFQLISLHGQSKDALAKTAPGAWEYDILFPGYKTNMTDIMAAIGSVQLSRYPQIAARRRELAAIYNRRLAGAPIQTMRFESEQYAAVPHLYIVLADGMTPERRNDLICRMDAREIHCNVHYKPLPMMTAYKKIGFDIRDFPNAYHTFCREITLPLHTLMSDEQAEFVSNVFLEELGC